MRFDIDPAPFKINEDTLTEPKENEIWVRSGDDVHKLAADIDDALEGEGTVDLACIGAGCLNQAIKAVAVARERSAKWRYDLVLQPFFSSFVDDEDRKRTRIILRVTTINL